ncbi:MAG: dTDP-glucose 4,6-dehydratase [Nitrososphaeria archaeon]
MKLIVTGGAGFIGSNFIIYWLKKHRKDEIVNIDKLTYAANLENLNEVSKNSNYKFIKCDIANLKMLDRLVKDVDAIVNFAAESHVDNSIKSSTNFIHSNIVGVHVLLELSRKYGIRLHQVSTDEVYGSLEINSKEKFSLKTPYNPRNPYSATKASADFLVRAYYNTYKIPVTISNCSNNFGPNQHPEKLIPKTILNALSDAKIPIYGNGSQIRDWIYVEDHCRGIESVLKNGEFGETYLFGGGNEKSNIEVVKYILEKLGKSQNLIEHITDRPGHDLRYAIDWSETEKSLGWRPEYSFEKGMELTIEHYKKNRERYVKQLGGA